VKDIPIDALADMPIHQRELAVYVDGNTLTRILDDLANVFE